MNWRISYTKDFKPHKLKSWGINSSDGRPTNLLVDTHQRFRQAK